MLEGAKRMSGSSVQFDAASLDILANLSKVIMPLDAWIAKRSSEGGYAPPDADSLPWRQGGKPLTIDEVRVVDFIVALIRETADDVTLLDRWQALHAEPLKDCPIDDKDQWRAARGLDGAAVFGAGLSQNVPADGGEPPLTRVQIYAKYLPLVVLAAKDVLPSNADDWRQFALDLFHDKVKDPTQASGPFRTSRFMLQLVRDLLYATLGMRNNAPEPFRSAVLTEIGELRRPGNVFTRADIARGLEDFRAILASYESPAAPVAAGAAEREESAPAFASASSVSDSVREHYLSYSNRRV